MARQKRVIVLEADTDFRVQIIRRLGQTFPNVKFIGAATVTEVGILLSADPVELLVVDLTCPDLDGANGVGRLKSTYPAVEIMVLLAAGQQTAKQRVYEAGVGYVLDMPFPAQVLVKLVAEALTTPRLFVAELQGGAELAARLLPCLEGRESLAVVIEGKAASGEMVLHNGVVYDAGVADPAGEVVGDAAIERMLRWKNSRLFARNVTRLPPLRCSGDWDVRLRQRIVRSEQVARGPQQVLEPVEVMDLGEADIVPAGKRDVGGSMMGLQPPDDEPTAELAPGIRKPQPQDAGAQPSPERASTVSTGVFSNLGFAGTGGSEHVARQAPVRAPQPSVQQAPQPQPVAPVRPPTVGSGFGGTPSGKFATPSPAAYQQQPQQPPSPQPAQFQQPPQARQAPPAPQPYPAPPQAYSAPAQPQAYAPPASPQTQPAVQQAPSGRPPAPASGRSTVAPAQIVQPAPVSVFPSAAAPAPGPVQSPGSPGSGSPVPKAATPAQAGGQSAPAAAGYPGSGYATSGGVAMSGIGPALTSPPTAVPPSQSGVGQAWPGGQMGVQMSSAALPTMGAPIPPAPLPVRAPAQTGPAAAQATAAPSSATGAGPAPQASFQLSSVQLSSVTPAMRGAGGSGSGAAVQLDRPTPPPAEEPPPESATPPQDPMTGEAAEGAFEAPADEFPLPPGSAPVEALMGRKLGKILFRMGLITEDDLRLAVRAQLEDGRRRKLGSYLVDNGACTAEEVDWGLAAQSGIRPARVPALRTPPPPGAIAEMVEAAPAPTQVSSSSAIFSVAAVLAEAGRGKDGALPGLPPPSAAARSSGPSLMAGTMPVQAGSADEGLEEFAGQVEMSGSGPAVRDRRVLVVSPAGALRGELSNRLRRSLQRVILSEAPDILTADADIGGGGAVPDLVVADVAGLLPDPAGAIRRWRASRPTASVAVLVRRMVPDLACRQLADSGATYLIELPARPATLRRVVAEALSTPRAFLGRLHHGAQAAQRLLEACEAGVSAVLTFEPGPDLRAGGQAFGWGGAPADGAWGDVSVGSGRPLDAILSDGTRGDAALRRILEWPEPVLYIRALPTPPTPTLSPKWPQWLGSLLAGRGRTADPAPAFRAPELLGPPLVNEVADPAEDRIPDPTTPEGLSAIAPAMPGGSTADSGVTLVITDPAELNRLDPKAELRLPVPASEARTVVINPEDLRPAETRPPAAQPVPAPARPVAPPQVAPAQPAAQQQSPTTPQPSTQPLPPATPAPVQPPAMQPFAPGFAPAGLTPSGKLPVAGRMGGDADLSDMVTAEDISTAGLRHAAGMVNGPASAAKGPVADAPAVRLIGVEGSGFGGSREGKVKPPSDGPPPAPDSDAVPAGVPKPAAAVTDVDLGEDQTRSAGPTATALEETVELRPGMGGLPIGGLGAATAAAASAQAAVNAALAQFGLGAPGSATATTTPAEPVAEAVPATTATATNTGAQATAAPAKSPSKITPALASAPAPAGSRAALRKRLEEASRRLVEDTEDGLAAGLVDLGSGLIMARHLASGLPAGDDTVDMVAAALVELFRGRTVRRVEDALRRAAGGKGGAGGGESVFDEVLLSGKGAHLFVRRFQGRDVAMVLAAGRATNIALAWSGLRGTMSDIADDLPAGE